MVIRTRLVVLGYRTFCESVLMCRHILSCKVVRLRGGLSVSVCIPADPFRACSSTPAGAGHGAGGKPDLFEETWIHLIGPMLIVEHCGEAKLLDARRISEHTRYYMTGFLHVAVIPISWGRLAGV